MAAGVSVVVLGAGLSGLAAACHLRGAGHDVVVLERELEIGGRSGRLEQDGYRFDTGPVVMTMPTCSPSRSSPWGPTRDNWPRRRGTRPRKEARHNENGW